MYPVTDRFLQALRASHRITVRVDAYLGNDLVAEDIPVSSGRVSVDSTSDVRRTVALTVPDPDLAINPYGMYLRVHRGIQYVNGDVELVPLGVFRVNDVRHNTSGGLSISGTDRAKQVADDRFLGPTQSVTANTIPAEIDRLIRQVNSTWTLLDQTSATTGTPALLWEEDRWEAVNGLAQAIGAEAFFDPTGVPVLRPIPSINNAPAWFVDAGEAGVLVQAEAAVNRERTYNAVVASGERTDNTPPVAATVTDNYPESPTYWHGPYGHVPYFYTSPVLTSVAQATLAAESILGRTRALIRQLRLTAVPNPALEGGDVIDIRWPDGLVERHILDKFDVPLNAADGMALETRSPTTDLE